MFALIFSRYFSLQRKNSDIEPRVWNSKITFYNLLQGAGVRKMFFGILIVCSVFTVSIILYDYIVGQKDCLELYRQNTSSSGNLAYQKLNFKQC